MAAQMNPNKYIVPFMEPRKKYIRKKINQIELSDRAWAWTAIGDLLLKIKSRGSARCAGAHRYTIGIGDDVGR